MDRAHGPQAPARVDVTRTPWLSKLVTPLPQMWRHSGLTSTNRSTSRLTGQCSGALRTGPWFRQEEARKEGQRGPLCLRSLHEARFPLLCRTQAALLLCVPWARTTSWGLGAPHEAPALPATRLCSSSSESLGGGHFLI